MSEPEHPDPDELVPSSGTASLEAELEELLARAAAPLPALGPAALTRELVMLAQELVSAASSSDPALLHLSIERVWAEVLSLASREERLPGEVVAAFIGWLARLPQLHAAAAVSLTHRGLGTSAAEVNTEAAVRIRSALASIEEEERDAGYEDS